MAKLTPQQYAEKQISRTSAASGDYAAGINRYNGNPMEKAAQNIDKWSANVASPETKAKMLRGLSRTSGAAWKQAATNKGAARLAQGVQEARPKIEAFAAAFLPHLDAGQQKVDAMPSTTYEQRKQKAIAMMDHNHTFKR